MAKTTGKYSTTHGMLGILPHPTWQHTDGSALKTDQKVHHFHEDGRHALLDYTCAHPSATTYVQAASNFNNATAARIERQKVVEYDEACNGEGYAFFPVGFESYGAFGEGASQFVERCCSIINNELPEGMAHTWTTQSFRSFYVQRISIAIQRGNKRAIRLRSTRDMRVDGATGVDPPAAAH